MIDSAPPTTLTPPRGTPSGAIAAPRYRNPFSVLIKHRNFRIFWFGQTGSLVGTWMQQVALGWVVLRFSYRRLTTEPDTCRREILAVCSARLALQAAP